MYLSRVLLTGERFRNPYEIHRALWSVFPDDPAQTRDFLFRVEQNSTSKAQILMQSLREPGEDASHTRILASKPVSINIDAGHVFRFLLVANPVKTIQDEQGRVNKNGDIKKSRVPLIKEEDQFAWLERKLAGAAQLKMMEINKLAPLHFRKGGRAGKIQPYAFKGVLQTNNPAQLMALITQGIGPAKAFGCGMLSLAPA